MSGDIAIAESTDFQESISNIVGAIIAGDVDTAASLTEQAINNHHDLFAGNPHSQIKHFIESNLAAQGIHIASSAHSAHESSSNQQQRRQDAAFQAAMQAINQSVINDFKKKFDLSGAMNAAMRIMMNNQLDINLMRDRVEQLDLPEGYASAFFELSGLNDLEERNTICERILGERKDEMENLNNQLNAFMEGQDQVLIERFTALVDVAQTVVGLPLSDYKEELEKLGVSGIEPSDEVRGKFYVIYEDENGDYYTFRHSDGGRVDIPADVISSIPSNNDKPSLQQQLDTQIAAGETFGNDTPAERLQEFHDRYDSYLEYVYSSGNVQERKILSGLIKKQEQLADDLRELQTELEEINNEIQRIKNELGLDVDRELTPEEKQKLEESIVEFVDNAKELQENYYAQLDTYTNQINAALTGLGKSPLSSGFNAVSGILDMATATANIVDTLSKTDVIRENTASITGQEADLASETPSTLSPTTDSTGNTHSHGAMV